MPTIFGDTAQTFWQRVALVKSLGTAQTLMPYYWYEMLEEYYFNNGLYDLVNLELHENAIWAPGMKPLRNPANRAVEFHVAKLWPGPLKQALPIIPAKKSDKLVAAIEQIWDWSNWAAAKQVAARWFANMGDMFIKVAEKAEDGQVTRVYLDPIKPKYVTDFELDERGFITFIRIDIPAGDQIHTEVWSKTRGNYRTWKHDRSLDTALEDLGAPDDIKTFEELQFDFIPIVHAKFRDVGEARGMGCFVHALDKIDEANRQVTRLHQILFRYNKPTNAISANAMDPSGRPMPPPSITGLDGRRTDEPGASLVTGDDELYELPGMSKIEQLVPDIRYDAALNIVNAHMAEIARDLPEVLYYDLKDQQLSGVALRTLLGAAIDRVIEARGSAEAALSRANQMALTIAGIHRLPGFEGLGTYEKGDFVHTFAERDVIPLTSREKAEAVGLETQSGIPLITAMLHNGYKQEEVDVMVQSQEYKMRMAKLAMEVLQLAAQTTVPAETVLRSMGWTDQQLTDMGLQRLAAIKLKQEDRVTGIQQ